MPSCFVPGCESGYRTTKDKHFFKPPTDNAEFAKWARAIPRRDRDLTNKCYICDSHFSDEYFIKSDFFTIHGKQVELPRQRWALKRGAVPHIFPNLPKYLTKPIKRRRSPLNRAAKLVKTASSDKDNTPKQTESLPDSNESCSSQSAPVSTTAWVTTTVKTENIALKKKVKNLNRSLTTAKTRLRIANANIIVLQKEINRLKSHLKHTGNSSMKHLSRKQKIIVDTMLKKCQLSNTKGMRYKNEFLLDSLLLKIKSPKGYRHCLNHELLPLPSESHLRKLVKGLKCSYGVNAHAISAIENNFRDETDANKRYGMLIFDEVKLREEVAFNSNSLKVDGFVNFGDLTPEENKNEVANHALVFMFVPLLFNWVQPVGVYASKNATPGDIICKILIQIILQLERAGAKVIGFTADGSQSNKRVWKSLGITGKKESLKCSIPNPYDENRKLWAFCDAVHVIKCIRNNFHQKNEVRYKGQTIQFNFYRRVYEEDSKPEYAGMRACPKLTSVHIDPSSFQKMNVRLAFQLFSGSMSKAIEFYRDILKVKGLEGSKATEEFTRDMNSLVDALNSSIPKNGLYNGSTSHMILMKWRDSLNMSVQANTFASQRTMESLRVTIESTLQVAEYLWANGFKYALTSKFNQDPLERHFGILRSLSCDDHPSTIDFLHLHMLQCIYVPTKLALSSGGNCGYVSEAPLTSFVNQMRILANETVQRNMEVKKRAESVVKGKLIVEENPNNIADWENNVSELADNESSSRRECLVYNLAGYIVKQAFKITKCVECANSIRGDPNKNIPASALTYIKDYGTSAQRVYLTHPSIDLYEILLHVESVVTETITNSEKLWGDVFFECLNKVPEIYIRNSKVGCSMEHTINIIPKLIVHYVKCRFFFHARQLRKELKTSQTAKSHRKLSKVADK